MPRKITRSLAILCTVCFLALSIGYQPQAGAWGTRRAKPRTSLTKQLILATLVVSHMVTGCAITPGHVHPARPRHTISQNTVKVGHGLPALWKINDALAKVPADGKPSSSRPSGTARTSAMKTIYEALVDSSPAFSHELGDPPGRDKCAKGAQVLVDNYAGQKLNLADLLGVLWNANNSK